MREVGKTRTQLIHEISSLQQELAKLGGVKRQREQAQDRVRRETARAKALARTAARLNAQLDAEAVLDAICEETARALHVPAVVVLYYDEGREVFYPAATRGLPPQFQEEYIPNPRSVYGQEPRKRNGQIVVPNLRALRHLTNADLFARYNVEAIAVASLNRDSRLLGALSAYTFDPERRFDQEDIELLKGLADQAAQAIQNANLFAAEQRRSEQFKVISKVGRHITSLLPVDELLFLIVRSIRDVFTSHHVGIALVEGDEVLLKAGVGYARDEHESVLVKPARFKIGADSILGWVASTGESLLIPDVQQESHRFQDVGSGIHSELAVPIKLKERVIGALLIECEKPEAFDESDRIMAQSLADQAAIAIENARLHEQTQQLVVLEERQRLARELHDSVTQSLYGMTLYADAATEWLASGETARAADYLREMQQTAQASLRELRLLIYQLRPPMLDEGLASALRERLEVVEGRSGLQTTLHVEGEITLATAVEEELYRIAQEALNNALKHAQAQCVHVKLAQQDEQVLMEIIDDGIGFSMDTIQEKGGLGLRGIEERVAKLGGNVTFKSRPGEGSRISVEVPTHV